MEKCEVTICSKCEKVKNRQGEFKKRDRHSVETIKMSKDLFVVIEVLCDECLVITTES